MYKTFNSPETLGVISSYPAHGGEIARANAISRYSYLLTNSFPNSQKVVVFCEKRKETDVPYLLKENILVVPSYKPNSPLFFLGLAREISKFLQVKDFLIQFEFSIYGGKKVIPAFLVLLLMLKVLGKNTSLVLHQVVSDLNDLSGHLGLSRDSLKIKVFNKILAGFYSMVGSLVSKIIVHDKLLKVRLTEFVDGAKILVIPHAVGDIQRKNLTARSKAIARRGFSLGIKDKVIGVYGYRSWYKGTDWIVGTARQLALRYPGKNIKLLVAGGVSPTLKDTWSYKNFDRRIKRVIKNADGSVVVTGFIKEKDVWKVFSASDVMVFPYRTRMSASGAFSLTLAYEKPFLVSRPFAKGMKIDEGKLIFDLNTFSFEQRFLEMIGNKKLNLKSVQISRNLAKDNNWASVANLYLNYCLSGKIFVGNTNAIEKAFQLV
jgi:glycosyltransferase involved in cell wall biosynthesis